MTSTLPFARILARTGWILALAVLIAGATVGCGDDDDPTPVTTGRVSGTVVEPQSGAPVVGAAVTIDPVTAKMSASTTTDTNGDYTIGGVEAGDYTLTVDASGVTVDAGDPTLQYSGFTTRITVTAGRTTETDAFSPIIDTDNESDVQDGTPTEFAPSGFDNLVISIDADAVTFPDGSTEGTLNIVELGYDQGPAALDAGVATSFMFQIIPQGTTFDPPATLQLPNRDGLPGGHSAELFSYDSASGWVSEGLMTTDGSLFGSTGTGIGEAGTHFVTCEPHTVTGRVFDLQETPVEGAAVQIHAQVYPFDGNGELVSLDGMTATTSSDGTFSVPNVRACRVTFTASLDGPNGFGAVGPGDPQVSGDTTTDLGTRIMELVTETTFNLAGTVRRSDGTPAAGVSVGWFDPNFNPNSKKGFVTDDFGRYAFELTYTPGAMLTVWAFDELTSEGGETEITVPSLQDQGVTVTADVTICGDIDEPCGETGTWSLSGSTMTITFTFIDCGESVTETQEIEVISLANGALTIQFEDEGETRTEVLTRVSGTGPSGVSMANMVGVYILESDFGYEFITLYANGTIVIVEGFPDAYGTYTDNGSSVDVVLQSDGGQIIDTLAYSRSGGTLSLTPPEAQEPEFYQECPDGVDLGGIQNEWILEDLDGWSVLLLYNGEIFRVSSFSIAKLAW